MSEVKENQQAFLDVFKLADKELIEKVLAVSKAIKVEKIDESTLRVSVDLKIG